MNEQYQGTPENPLACGCIYPDQHRCAHFRELGVQYCTCDCHSSLLTPWGEFYGEQRKEMLAALGLRRSEPS